VIVDVGTLAEQLGSQRSL